MDEGKKNLIELFSKYSGSFTVGFIFFTLAFYVLNTSRTNTAPSFFSYNTTGFLRGLFPLIPNLTYADSIIFLSLFLGAWLILKTIDFISKQSDKEDKNLLILIKVLFGLLFLSPFLYINMGIAELFLLIFMLAMLTVYWRGMIILDKEAIPAFFKDVSIVISLILLRIIEVFLDFFKIKARKVILFLQDKNTIRFVTSIILITITLIFTLNFSTLSHLWDEIINLMFSLTNSFSSRGKSDTAAAITTNNLINIVLFIINLEIFFVIYLKWILLSLISITNQYDKDKKQENKHYYVVNWLIFFLLIFGLSSSIPGNIIQIKIDYILCLSLVTFPIYQHIFSYLVKKIKQIYSPIKNLKEKFIKVLISNEKKYDEL